MCQCRCGWNVSVVDVGHPVLYHDVSIFELVPGFGFRKASILFVFISFWYRYNKRVLE